MNTNLNLIPRDELEPLLSEYATGMLDTGLKARVEASLALYPDLQNEVDFIRSAFARVDRVAHNAAIDYETRNLSVHVINALSTPKRSPLRHLAWLAPAAAALVVFVLTTGGPAEPTQIADNKPRVSGTPITQPIMPTPAVQTPSVANGLAATQPNDTAVPEIAKRKTQRRTPAQLRTREELIVDDLVADQIVYRMASETADDVDETVTGITDSEIDVLLAAVVSYESL